MQLMTWYKNGPLVTSTKYSEYLNFEAKLRMLNIIVQFSPSFQLISICNFLSPSFLIN
jgi:hypothetical protein